VTMPKNNTGLIDIIKLVHTMTKGLY